MERLCWMLVDGNAGAEMLQPDSGQLSELYQAGFLYITFSTVCVLHLYFVMSCFYCKKTHNKIVMGKNTDDLCYVFF